ncbi:MAG: hypothetical protein O3B70_00355 [Bacteroidetes bacterium]|nr:hypothetical protein [Bacteroidota bacterium]MDA0902766.1 hypothetical protein [Bacteroidota bacterium]MDA1242903.1 hypothetical protein [Bacteroidota bacterium]
MIEADLKVQGFEDMAPLSGQRAQDAMVALRESRDWVRDLSRLIPGERAEQVVALWRNIDLADHFQSGVVKPFVDALIEETTSGVTWEGSAESMEKGRLFLSNHRDIVLDPSLINVALMESGRMPTEIGIGSNLLGSEWVRDLVRLNRCFVVQRSGSPRERFHHSLRTASYIRHTIEQGNSVWLAHREGRAKDGIDVTAPALMRTLSDGCHEEVWNSMRVVPVSISYEWDPCDAMKVHELLTKQRDGQYVKQPGEDELSMWTGLVGFKGRVCLQFGPMLEWMADVESKKPERDMAKTFDMQMHAGMKIWPNQLLSAEFLGLDEILSSDDRVVHVGEDDRRIWRDRMDSVVRQLQGRGWSTEEIQRKWCEISSGPCRSLASWEGEHGHGNGASN